MVACKPASEKLLKETSPWSAVAARLNSELSTANDAASDYSV
jgi:hypothetical protein